MRYLILFSWLYFGVVYGCTDFVIQTRERQYVNGRSLEFAIDIQSALKMFSRGQKGVSSNPQQGQGVQWVSKHGFIAVTCFGKNIVLDGMNEKGLGFGYLWLPGCTQYPELKPQEMGMALDFLDMGSWVLGNFSSVAEVKAALAGVRIWGHDLPPLGTTPVHATIHDSEGNHLVVEFVGGAMQVYDNPVAVLTNSPPFNWQLTNLQNYVSLNAENAPPVAFGSLNVSPPGEGSGLMGIPGDWTPPSRFVKIATYLRMVKKPANAEEGVNLAEHLLNTVDIPMGGVRDNGKPSDYTQWVVIKDLNNKAFYFRSYRGTTIKKIDLKKIDFKKVLTKEMPLMGAGCVDVTSEWINRQ